MHRLLLTAILIILIILITLAACFDAGPTPETAQTPVPGTIAAPPANTPEPMETTAPTPTRPPANTPAPPGVPAPLTAQDREAVISSLSDAELTCIDQNPERMIATLIGGPGD